MITVTATTSDNPLFRELVTMLDQELRGEYQALQDYYSQFNQVASLDLILLAFIKGAAAGCGCFKHFDDSAVEIKRMYVKQAHRGSGAAKAILCELESRAAECGYQYAVLETGNKQQAALKFYQRQGYEVIPNYGQYAGMETSVCMKKKINNNGC